MSTTISINRKTVKEFFEASRQNPILIPEYQRPYEWDSEEVITLFDDLREFVESASEKSDETSQQEDYFLGIVVHYDNNNQREIIDGHQRIITLTLLLRVIYTHLESMNKSDAVNENRYTIERLLWKKNRTVGTVDKTRVLIHSEVIDEVSLKNFMRILETGIADPKADDLYSQNYILLQELYQKYCGTNLTAAFNFIYTLLEQIILLPIQADSMEMALTIFSTLNDRGKPLTDADILKAKIYKALDDDARKTFIGNWQNLEEFSKELEIDIVEDVFAPYMFYTRAVNGWNTAFYSGVRKYFLNEKPQYLCDPKLMSNFDRILNFWSVVKQHAEIDGEPWSRDTKILQALEILVLYPNDFWKHAVITYYFANSARPNFIESFSSFLRKLLAQIVPRCFIRRAIDITKVGIINLNVLSSRSPYPSFNFKLVEGVSNFTDKIKLSSKNAKNSNSIKMLLKIIAYADPEQTATLPDKLQIEHIYPRKWVDNYDLNGFTSAKINELIEKLGNLTLFEKKHNIRASNEYFAKKKKSYKQSKVAMTQRLAELNDFRPENIITRTDEMNRRLKNILETWSAEYDDAKRIYEQRLRAEERL